MVLTLSGCWMDGNRIIEVLLTGYVVLGRAFSHNRTILTSHFNSNSKALQSFVATLADYVYPYYALFLANDNQFKYCWFLMRLVDLREIKRAERGFVYLRLTYKIMRHDEIDNVHIFTSLPYTWTASASVSPMVPIGGCLTMLF